MIKKYIMLGFMFLAGTSVLLAQQKKIEKPQESAQNIYGDNIIRLSPVNIFDHCFGLGMTYERVLSRSQKISLVLPIFVAVPIVSNNRGINGPKYADYPERGNGGEKFFYVSPGFKYYPFAQQHKTTYAIGVNFMFGYGEGDGEVGYATLGGPHYESTTNQYLRMGAYLNNYVNFQITKIFCIGIFAGLGTRFVDQEKVSGPVSESYQYPAEGFWNLGFNIGFRF